jgi:type IV pilus assembly protein PilB
MPAPQNKRIRIGDVLKDLGYIDDDQLDQALAYQREHRGTRLGQALINLGIITEDQMLQALSKRLDLPLVDVGSIDVDVDAVRLVPENIARETGTFPVAADERTITIITDDPLNLYGIEEIRRLTGRSVNVEIAKRTAVARATDYYYAEVNPYVEAEEASLEFNDLSAMADNMDVNGSADDAPIINLLNSLIRHAYRAGASDIHIEPFQEFTNIRIRVDGQIHDYLTIQRGVHAPLIARIKIIGNMDIAERHLPQDGHFRINIAGDNVNVRVSVIPTVFGEKAVLRLLSNNTNIEHSGTYGMPPDDYEKFCHILEAPNGIIYLTGPTGSGKTTTLYMVLTALSQENMNISTIEDPVEKNIPRITQVQVNETAGLTFDAGLRALMRQDPDIIMVGETRDVTTARIAVRAAITGHRVFSTLHTNNATGSIARLLDMGIEPYMLSSSLSGVVAQRLMRKVCPNCAVQRAATANEKELLGVSPDQDVTLTEGRGCHACNQTGYRDRMAVHEILVIDRKVRQLVNDHATIDDIQDYAVNRQGMRTLGQAAAAAVVAGKTTMEEYLKIVYEA